MLSILFLYSLAIFATSLFGGLVPLSSKSLKEELAKIFVSLGAGLLLGMALVHMLPEAAELVPHVFGVWFLVGFLILLILERFVMIHACDEYHCDYHTIGLTAFIGLAVHGVIEGVALASSAASHLGFLVLVAILVHKAPTGFALSSILTMAKKTKKQILLFLIGVSLSGPIGVFLGYFLLKHSVIQSMSGILLSISAGTFLYIAACDLLPELHKTNEDKFKRLFSFLMGILMSILSFYFGHIGGHS
jgi:zinc and cadmium transporter